MGVFLLQMLSSFLSQSETGSPNTIIPIIVYKLSDDMFCIRFMDKGGQSGTLAVGSLKVLRVVAPTRSVEYLLFDFYPRPVLAFGYCRCLSLYFNKKKILRVDSSRRARDTAAMLDHSRHHGESATKTVKFFVAHTVNCVICNNHTIIDWMLLNFTPVIQQNCHQPGRKFEKSFCAVDRLSCQLEL